MYSSSFPREFHLRTKIQHPNPLRNDNITVCYFQRTPWTDLILILMWNRDCFFDSISLFNGDYLNCLGESSCGVVREARSKEF